MNEQLLNSVVQSLVRAGLIAAATKLGIEANHGSMNEAVAWISAIVLAGLSLGWSALNHKKNIETDPSQPTKPGGSGTLGLLLAVTLGGIMAAGTVSMQGCKGGQVTAQQIAEWRAEADKGEADIQANIDAAIAEGNTAAAEKAQAVLDKFRAERAKWESKIKTDEQGNLDVESSLASAAMVAAPPGVGAALLVGLALLKRIRANTNKPPAVPPST